MELQCYFIVAIWIFIGVSCEQCTDNDVRLVGGQSMFEGRVEICRGNIWGTICGSGWDWTEASVVCRQLGVTLRHTNIQETFSWQPSGPLILNSAWCHGDEPALINCSTMNASNPDNNCRRAAVRCKGIALVDISWNDTSVLVSWASNPVPLNYQIFITRTVNTSKSPITHSIFTVLPSNSIQFESGDLLPGQDYRACVCGVYRIQPRTQISFCRNFQTYLPPTLTTAMASTRESVSVGSCNCSLLGGVLGFIIALLVLLLIVAGVGLAYPRCIRSRVKDKRYLSSISQFLDKNMYLTNNAAYIDHSQHPQVGGSNAGAGLYIPPTYEAVRDPPTGPRTGNTSDRHYDVLEPTPGEPRQGPVPTSQVTTDDIMAQHYEMSSVPNPVPQSRDYEVPVNAGTDSSLPLAGGRDRDYSRLQHQ